MRTRMSWQQKMDNPKLPKVIAIPEKMQKRFGSGTMLVPSPRQVDTAIRKLRKGTVSTVSGICESLAAMNAADVACPITTGIFVRIAAEAAAEEAQQGKTKITPYWQVVKNDGSLNPNFQGGVARQARNLRDEGHRIVAGDSKHPPRIAAKGAGRSPK